MSASIAELSRLLGTLLFLWERRAIRLTDAGHRLLALARGIEREFLTAETSPIPGRAPLRPLQLDVLP